MNDENWNEYPIHENRAANEKDSINNGLMAAVILLGGFEVGISTNSDSGKRPNFITVNGEKVVCTAQGGECRVYGEFYTMGGLRDSDSWKTPIISKTCPNNCPYKCIVCDDHEHGDDENVGVFIPYPERNKFRGQFTRYCEDFERLEINNANKR